MCFAVIDGSVIRVIVPAKRRKIDYLLFYLPVDGYAVGTIPGVVRVNAHEIGYRGIAARVACRVALVGAYGESRVRYFNGEVTKRSVLVDEGILAIVIPRELDIRIVEGLRSYLPFDRKCISRFEGVVAVRNRKVCRCGIGTSIGRACARQGDGLAYEVGNAVFAVHLGYIDGLHLSVIDEGRRVIPGNFLLRKFHRLRGYRDGDGIGGKRFIKPRLTIGEANFTTVRSAIANVGKDERAPRFSLKLYKFCSVPFIPAVLVARGARGILVNYANAYPVLDLIACRVQVENARELGCLYSVNTEGNFELFELRRQHDIAVRHFSVRVSFRVLPRDYLIALVAIRSVEEIEVCACGKNNCLVERAIDDEGDLTKLREGSGHVGAHGVARSIEVILDDGADGAEPIENGAYINGVGTRDIKHSISLIEIGDGLFALVFGNEVVQLFNKGFKFIEVIFIRSEADDTLVFQLVNTELGEYRFKVYYI